MIKVLRLIETAIFGQNLLLKFSTDLCLKCKKLICVGIESTENMKTSSNIYSSFYYFIEMFEIEQLSKCHFGANGNNQLGYLINMGTLLKSLDYPNIVTDCSGLSYNNGCRAP